MDFKLASEGHLRPENTKCLIGMPVPLLQELDDRARVEGRTRSHLVREMIIAYLEKTPERRPKNAWTQRRYN